MIMQNYFYNQVGHYYVCVNLCVYVGPTSPL